MTRYSFVSDLSMCGQTYVYERNMCLCACVCVTGCAYVIFTGSGSLRFLLLFLPVDFSFFSIEPPDMRMKELLKDASESPNSKIKKPPSIATCNLQLTTYNNKG